MVNSLCSASQPTHQQPSHYSFSSRENGNRYQGRLTESSNSRTYHPSDSRASSQRNRLSSLQASEQRPNARASNRFSSIKDGAKALGSGLLAYPGFLLNRIGQGLGYTGLAIVQRVDYNIDIDHPPPNLRIINNHQCRGILAPLLHPWHHQRP